jgi:hypothetical protein
VARDSRRVRCDPDPVVARDSRPVPRGLDRLVARDSQWVLCRPDAEANRGTRRARYGRARAVVRDSLCRLDVAVSLGSRRARYGPAVRDSLCRLDVAVSLDSRRVPCAQGPAVVRDRPWAPGSPGPDRTAAPVVVRACPVRVRAVAVRDPSAVARECRDVRRTGCPRLLWVRLPPPVRRVPWLPAVAGPDREVARRACPAAAPTARTTPRARTTPAAPISTARIPMAAAPMPVGSTAGRHGRWALRAAEAPAWRYPDVPVPARTAFRDEAAPERAQLVLVVPDRVPVGADRVLVVPDRVPVVPDRALVVPVAAPRTVRRGRWVVLQFPGVRRMGLMVRRGPWAVLPFPGVGRRVTVRRGPWVALPFPGVGRAETGWTLVTGRAAGRVTAWRPVSRARHAAVRRCRAAVVPVPTAVRRRVPPPSERPRWVRLRWVRLLSVRRRWVRPLPAGRVSAGMAIGTSWPAGPAPGVAGPWPVPSRPSVPGV